MVVAAMIRDCMGYFTCFESIEFGSVNDYYLELVVA